MSEELDLIGISPKVKGRKYLRDAIEMTCDKEQPNLCSQIAKSYSVSSASVERAMQGAINRAWNTTDTETLETQYTAYINPERGYPTIMEFVYYYADKVKK
ncbi:MAG: sporulation initiation factor Spo0A C-terminal domain-containing protein [Ruminococcus sp.]|nr:sporulation initiation factor Spo0A C-terminal domain-containing protein [Ruminococcus sp.]